MIPQIIYLALTLIGLGRSMEQHGKPKTGEHNMWISVIAIAIVLWILYEGGFFDVMLNN